MLTLDRPRVEYRTPVDLVTEVRRGLVRIPPFQRGFKWESGDVTALFDSILRGYPIGNLLFWRRPAPAGQVRVGPLEIDAPAVGSAYWVVDGQQRITSLAGALAAAEQATDTRFRIHLDLDEEKFHALGIRQPAPQHWLPVSRLVDTPALLSWMRDNHDWLTQDQIALADSAAKAIREYQIPTYVVAADDENALRKIFDRLNNTGKPLNKAEVFHALHSGMSKSQPNDLRGLGTVTAELGFGALDERLSLRCVLAFRGGDIYRDDFQDEFVSEEDRASTFREVGLALSDVVELIRGEALIPHVKLLPYTHVVPVLTRFVRLHGPPTGRVAQLLRRWIWRDAVGGLQTRSTSVAALRQAVAAVEAADPYRAAQQLLRLAPGHGTYILDIGKTHLNHGAAKINLLGLLSTGPLSLRSGSPMDPAQLVDEASLVREIVPVGREPLSHTFANRAIVDSRLGQPVRIAIAQATEEIAASHLVTPQMQRMLRDGEDRQFLLNRADQVTDAISRHMATMAEYGARDTQAVSDMIRSVA